MTLAARIFEIEAHALAAWPAAELKTLDGWKLRAMSGITRRANSVWTARAEGRLPLAQRIAEAEAFYRERGLRAAFQVGAHSDPPELDAALSARGYVIDAPVSVQVASASSVVARCPSAAIRASVGPVMDDVWFELASSSGRFAALPELYRGLLSRLGERALFATASIDGAPAALALGVLGPRWLGVSSMFTLPGYRKRGAARAILRALAGAAPAKAGANLYLQVERDNQQALSVYAALGFEPHHGYHYRVAKISV